MSPTPVVMFSRVLFESMTPLQWYISNTHVLSKRQSEMVRLRLCIT